MLMPLLQLLSPLLARSVMLVLLCYKSVPRLLCCMGNSHSCQAVELT